MRQPVAMVTEPQQVSLDRNKRFETLHARFTVTSKLVFLEILCCKSLQSGKGKIDLVRGKKIITYFDILLLLMDSMVNLLVSEGF